MKQVLLILLLFISFEGFSQSVQFGNLEVMEKDLGEMDWDQALKEVAELGNGWRLPTIEKLIIIHDNNDEMAGFNQDLYWSSTEADEANAWLFDYPNGDSYYDPKYRPAYVRAVRDVK